MSAASPLLVISYDPEERINLDEITDSLGYPDAHFVTGELSEIISELESRTISPEYMIIDIGDHADDIFSDLDEIAMHCEPNVRVVVIGSVNDINFYRELKSRGIVEYCARPVKISDIREILLKSHGNEYNNVKASSSNRGSVISCISAASGDGASTFAVNLAYCLAEEFNKSTLLIDMDYQFGLISKGLDLTAPFGIRELFDYPERGVDDMLVEKMQVKYSDNLSIVASPNELRKLPMVKPELIRDMIALLRKKFDFIILDIPHIWTGWTATSLTYSDKIVMVAQLWLRSLTHSSRMISAWQEMGISKEFVSLIINRSGAKFKEAITSQDFERILRHKIDAYVNNDIRAVVNAEANGQTLFEMEQSTAIQQQIRQFAQNIIVDSGGTGKYFDDNPTSKKKLLSFLGKKG
ncbi:MAG: AAA family ATPase [Rickettsiales bacterium]